MDLLEAEGRLLRLNVRRVGWGLALLAGGAALLLAGLALLLGSLYLYLATVVSPHGSVFLCGLVTVLLAGGLLWTARRLTR